MAFVVETAPQRFEVRESRATPKGPRSKTLATFHELNDEIVEKVQARAEKPPTAEDLRQAALRAGAPLAAAPIDEAGQETLRRISRGEHLDPKLRLLLLDALAREGPDNQPPTECVSDAARSATEWIGVSVEQRAKALQDLLELVDALPLRPRGSEIGFPRLGSS